MMKYKMVVSDYGETMVNTGKKLHQDNIDAIIKYQNYGGLFVIASGREWPSIRRKLNREFEKELPQMPVICCYGSMVAMSRTSEILFSAPIPTEVVRSVVDLLENEKIAYSLVTENLTIVKSDIDLSSLAWKNYGNKKIVKNFREIQNHLDFEGNRILKIDIYDLSKLDKILNEIEFRHPCKLKWYTNKLGFAEFVSVAAGKGKAFDFLIKSFRVKLEEAVVIGDSVNDIELFEHSKNKVAVSNAIKQILELSDSIIDNDEYKAISRFLNSIVDGIV